jgi:hypothetical protein
MNNLDEIKKCNKSEIIEIFNDQLIQFINQLEIIVIECYNNNIINCIIKDDIIFYKNLANTTLYLTHSYIIESFGRYIVRNSDIVPAIMSNDINFVLNYNFENDESIHKYKEKYKNNLNIEDLIKIIKQTIQYFSDENKNLIFEYLQILSQITIIYMSKI